MLRSLPSNILLCDYEKNYFLFYVKKKKNYHVTIGLTQFPQILFFSKPCQANHQNFFLIVKGMRKKHAPPFQHAGHVAMNEPLHPPPSGSSEASTLPLAICHQQSGIPKPHWVIINNKIHVINVTCILLLIMIYWKNRKL